MTGFAAADRYLEDRLESSLAELSRLVAQPSVATSAIAKPGETRESSFKSTLVSIGSSPRPRPCCALEGRW